MERLRYTIFVKLYFSNFLPKISKLTIRTGNACLTPQWGVRDHIVP